MGMGFNIAGVAATAITIRLRSVIIPMGITGGGMELTTHEYGRDANYLYSNPNNGFYTTGFYQLDDCRPEGAGLYGRRKFVSRHQP